MCWAMLLALKLSLSLRPGRLVSRVVDSASSRNVLCTAPWAVEVVHLLMTRLIVFEQSLPLVRKKFDEACRMWHRLSRVL